MKRSDALHSWNLAPKEAAALQKELVPLLEFPPLDKEIHFVAGGDISYNRGDSRLFAAVVLLSFPALEIVEIVSDVGEATFPYVSGLLAFREVPPICRAFAKLKQKPDVLLCDGQGIAHPRGLGLASHLGLWLDIPTIGCAKSRLVGHHVPLPEEKGAQVPLSYKERVVGSVLRSRTRVKPLFISPGHKIDLESSLQIVQQCILKTRLAEPTRQAHLAVNKVRQQTLKGDSSKASRSLL